MVLNLPRFQYVILKLKGGEKLLFLYCLRMFLCCSGEEESSLLVQTGGRQHRPGEGIYATTTQTGGVP